MNPAQSEIDFARLEADRPLFEQWERNQKADAHNWTDEAMAMVWCLGRSDWEWWNSLPNYFRAQTIEAYQFEQQQLEWRLEQGLVFHIEEIELENESGIWRKKVRSKHGRIRPYSVAVRPLDPETMAAFNDRVESMVQQLAADWSANRPPSIFTYDDIVAGAVSARLGRKVEAIKPRDLDKLNALNGR